MRITLGIVLTLLIMVLMATPVLGHAGEEHTSDEPHNAEGGVSGMNAVAGIAGLAAVAGIGWWIWTQYGTG